MTANVKRSQRGTAWRNFVDAAFMRGFDDARTGRGFAAEYDKRSKSWQWTYESGRQFAAWCAGRGVSCELRRQDGQLTVAAMKYLPRAFASAAL